MNHFLLFLIAAAVLFISAVYVMENKAFDHFFMNHFLVFLIVAAVLFISAVYVMENKAFDHFL